MAEIGHGFALGIPIPVWIFAVVALLAAIVLKFLSFGRNLYTEGSNSEAARLAGVNVGATLLIAYIISGALAGLTALIFLSRLTVAEPTAGTGIELEAIAVTVIGGTSLFGGEGGVGGTSRRRDDPSDSSEYVRIRSALVGLHLERSKAPSYWRQCSSRFDVVVGVSLLLGISI